MRKFTLALIGLSLPILALALMPTPQVVAQQRPQVVVASPPVAAVSASVTRPADTTAYADGDLMANSTTAGSVVPLQWTIARATDTAIRVTGAKVRTSNTSVTNAVFRVHLYRVSPTVANGDNGAWSSSGSANYVGCVDVTVDKAFTDGAAGTGIPCTGLASTTVTFPVAGTRILYGLIEVKGAYTPTSAQVTTVTLEVER